MNLLLGSQCLHGFEGSGAACWNDGSCEREQEYGDRGQHDYGWVERIDLKEQVAQQARAGHKTAKNDFGITEYSSSSARHH